MNFMNNTHSKVKTMLFILAALFLLQAYTQNANGTERINNKINIGAAKITLDEKGQLISIKATLGEELLSKEVSQPLISLVVADNAQNPR